MVNECFVLWVNEDVEMASRYFADVEEAIAWVSGEGLKEYSIYTVQRIIDKMI